MQVHIYKDYQTLSLQAAKMILDMVKESPAAVFCLATGDTPRLTYELMVKIGLEEKVNFSRCTFIGLDEWMGVPPQNEGSCRFFLENLVFKPLNINENQVYLFDGLSADPGEDCNKMDKIIKDKNGIDLMLVGVGMNGHIGFNEPGVSVDKYAHVVDLDDTTRSVGQKYFRQTEILKQGITLGFMHVLHSRKLIMMASGLKKSEVIRKALEEEINNQIPASLVRNHLHAHVMLDDGAASLLKDKKA